jgi:hypothetical protein
MKSKQPESSRRGDIWINTPFAPIARQLNSADQVPAWFQTPLIDVAIKLVVGPDGERYLNGVLSFGRRRAEAGRNASARDVALSE